MTPREEQVFPYFMKSPAQAHSNEKHAIGMRIGALLRHRLHRRATPHAEDLVSRVTTMRNINQLAEPAIRLGRVRAGAEVIVPQPFTVLVDQFGPAVAV